jgi:predicted methyltransferase
MKHQFKFSSCLVKLGMALSLLTGFAATLTVNYAEILTLPTRPETERKLDAVRKPQEVMAFYEVKRGDKVADLLTARGYYAVILSHIVGPEGIVYAASATSRPELLERIKQPSLANVRAIDGPLAQVALPQDGSLDFVIIHLNYHDLAPEVRGPMNQRVLAALKKGGIYGVVDHSAKEGSGNEAAKTLHRIDKLLVIKEVTSAGFTLASEGTMLRNPEDTHTTNQREHSDRFVLKFEKP